jgi:hypothetical protein
MALELSWPVLTIAVLSWLLSLYLLTRLWRSKDLLPIKLGLTLLLLVPVFGPFVYFWTLSFPAPMHPDLRDRWGRGADLTHMWRNWFEAIGKLPPLVQHFKKRRRK